VISTQDIVFNKDSVFNRRIEDLRDSLMHNTLNKIATHVRNIELPTPTQPPETQLFYEDKATAESSDKQGDADPPGYY
jgi:hypothetical protein